MPDVLDAHKLTVMGWPGINDGFRAEVARFVREQGEKGGDKHGTLRRMADYIETLPLNDPRLVELNRLQRDSDHYGASPTTMDFLARAGQSLVSPDHPSDAFHELLMITSHDRARGDANDANRVAAFETTKRKLSEEINAEQDRTRRAENLAALRANELMEERRERKALQARLNEMEPANA